ncbi:MAG: HAMP domain-containing histidine kinase, partial [Lachnospiraceae bacterium]|nr:HAMP domain-containing histidine kinase [Lachnospiraceae bacterium]
MKKSVKTLKILMILAAGALFSLLCRLLWAYVPRSGVRYSLLAVTGGIFALAGLWIWVWQRQIFRFADEICDTLDALISGRQPEVERPYEDSVTARVQGKLLQYYDIMNEGKVQSQRDKQTIQELVSDISHQVKTPIANIQMFTGILR